MASLHQTSGQAFGRLFALFIITAFFLSIALTGVFVLPTLNERIRSFYQESAQAELRSHVQFVNQYLEDRVQALKDIATFPVIVNGVMQENKENPNLKDFLDTSLLLGKKTPLTVLNLNGEIVYRTVEHLDIDYPKAGWVNDILENKREHKTNLLIHHNQDYLQLAVPVVYQGYAEGLLITEIPFNMLATFKDTSKTHYTSLQLEQEGIVLGKQEKFKNPLVFSQLLEDASMILTYTIDKDYLEKEQEKFVFYIFIVLGLSQLAAFTLFVFLGKRILIKPYKELSESREKARLMEAAIINARDGVIISYSDLDRPGPEIVYVNEAFTKISGYTREDVLGKNPRLLQGEKTDKETLRRLRNCLEKGEIFEGELINYHKNGKEYWLEISIVPVTDETGRITHFTAIERDISERKRSEEELIQAKEEAEKANVTKSEFLANMSHELRTPMNGILGLSELLIETSDCEEDLEMLTAIKTSGETLLALLNDILDISKVEAGDLIIESVVFDPVLAVEEVIQLYLSIASQKGISLYFDKKELVSDYVIGDIVRFQQILRNLVSNALKFTKEGEVSVTLSSETMIDGNVELYFSVRDTGLGIAEEKLSCIFDKFTQADASTTRKFGGSGLGLAISKELVELMKGRIGVESVEDKGTIFYCALPVGIADKSKTPVNLFKKKTKETHNSSFKKEKIKANAHFLLVDDHPINIRFMQKLLQTKGFNSIDIAKNGKEALEKSKNKNYDLIFMDCQMPEMDGYAATEKIREREKETQQHQLIVAMTANAMMGDKEKCLNAGMDDYISKPVRQKVLMDILYKYLKSDHLPEKNNTEEETQETAIKRIDMAHFLTVFKDISEKEAEELLDVFYAQSVHSLKTLQETSIDKEWEESLHKLKGSAGNMGALHLSYLCEKAEGFLKEETSLKERLLDEIKNEIEHVKLFLIHYWSLEKIYNLKEKDVRD